jgi:hypothetical protein
MTVLKKPINQIMYHPGLRKYFMRLADGRLIEVADPKLSNVNPGFASQYVPGRGRLSASEEQEDLLSRLPAADISDAVGPGVVRGGEQGRGARREQGEYGGLPPPAPTYRPLGGAKQNYRGNSQVLTLSGTTPEQVVNSFVATPRDAGDDAENLMVVLGQKPVTDAAIGVGNAQWDNIVDAIAVLTWGIGGAQFDAEIDWQQGTCFTIPASFLRIGLRLGPGGDGEQEASFLFSAAIAYGSGGSRLASPLRRTISPTISGNPSIPWAAGQQSDIMSIPAFANSATIVDRSNGSWRLELLSAELGASFGVNYERNDYSNAASQFEAQFPIPNGYRMFRVQNVGLSTAFSPKVIFNLALPG